MGFAQHREAGSALACRRRAERHQPSHREGRREAVSGKRAPDGSRLFLRSGKNPGFTWSLMPDEAHNKRNAAAYNDGRGKEIPQRGDADEKYRRAADGENRSRDAFANRYLRRVNLRTRRPFSHTAPSGTRLPRIRASRRRRMVRGCGSVKPTGIIAF